MSFSEHKIINYGSGVSALPDYPSDEGYTAAELKAVFDARADNEIKEKHNALVDEVEKEIGEIKGRIVPLEAGEKVSEHNADTGAHADIRETVSEHVESASNPHGVTAEQIGLGNVDDTSDADKPISNAVQSALDEKADTIRISTAVAKTHAATDSVESPLISLSMYGESTQDGTPTPSAPIDVVSLREKSNKNLLNPADYTFSSAEDSGVTTKINADGSITLNGTVSEEGYELCFNPEISSDIPHCSGGTYIENGTYTFSIANLSLEDGGGYREGLLISGDKDRINNAINIGTVLPQTFTVADVAGYAFLILYISLEAGRILNNLTIYPQLEAGSVATKYEPHPELIANPKISIHGKNLLPYPYNNTTVNGVTFTDNGDGTITANGTATATTLFHFMRNNQHLDKGKYYLSGCPANGSNDRYYLALQAWNGNTLAFDDTDVGNGVSVDLSTVDYAYVDIYFAISSGVTVESLVIKPYFGINSNSNEYEPCMAHQEVEIPYTLRGLKDARGNWAVRDEIVVSDNSVKLIQRIKPLVFAGTENIVQEYQTSSYTVFDYTLLKDKKAGISNVISTHFKTGQAFQGSDVVAGRGSIANVFSFTSTTMRSVADFKTFLAEQSTKGTPVTVYYELITPIETDITDTEAGQALLALKAYYPNTSIICDADCECTYKADSTNAYKALLARIEAIENA